MPALEKRIERLEAQLKAKSTRASEWQCPGIWEEFARQSDVRSGSRIVKFDPYSYQSSVVAALVERSIIVGKTRQLGLTETLANWALWRAIREPGFMALFLSKTQRDTSAIARRVKRSIEGFKGAIQLRTNNVCDLEVVGGGRLLFANSSRNGVRGLESVSFALVDEGAFVEGMEEVYSSLGPALSSGGPDARVAIVSTPNGQQGWFWGKLSENNGSVDLMVEIEEARSAGWRSWIDEAGWQKILIHWKSHPQHSQNLHYLEQIKDKYGLSERALCQEFDLNFAESSKAVFSPGLVRNAIVPTLQRLKSRSEGVFYAGVDSCGTGDDYAVCCILRLAGDALEVVTWYRARSGSSDLHLFNIGNLLDEWCPRRSAVEKNSMGQVWLESLARDHGSLDIEGISTSQTSKSVMIDRLLMLLEGSKIKIPKDCPLIEELLSFQREGSQMQAAQGKHDDFVMALALAVAASPLGAKQEPKPMFTALIN